MEYAIFNRPIVTIYDSAFMEKETPKNAKMEGVYSTISDEGLYGNTCKILAYGEGFDTAGQVLPEGMAELITAYGYHGYARAEELSFAREQKLRAWLGRNFQMVSRIADVLTVPDVRGARLLTSLARGCVIEVLPERTEDAPMSALPLHVNGWQRVRLVDERVGYMRDTSLKADIAPRTAVFYLQEGRTFGQALAMAQGIAESEIVSSVLKTYFDNNEQLFRESVVQTALQYLGSEYRWGGKTTAGIDCSGLASMAYLQNGVLIYRDAKIIEGWPMREIDRAVIKPADLLYFPGHVAVYVGQGRYVHATGAAQSGGVVINSLLPNDPLYRADLFEQITAVGSVF